MIAVLPKPFVIKSQTVMESDGCDIQDDTHFVEVQNSEDHVLGHGPISNTADKHWQCIDIIFKLSIIQHQFPYFPKS